MAQKTSTNPNKKIIDAAIMSIDGSQIIQKCIDDFNYGKRSFQTKETLQSVSIAISIFLLECFRRAHYFGRTDDGSAAIRSIEKGKLLLKFDDQVRSSNAQHGSGGALRSNGVIISVSGFKDEQKNEYFSWVIMHTIERRLNECGLSLGDNRFQLIEGNHYVEREKKRLAKLNA